jgi:segregation and condensation protein A
MSAAPDIFLPRFEGPLDLLLSLVRKNELEISDIPIAEITRQYLEYLHQAEVLNIDLGSEFVYIAALLIHIKSRCLLPQDPAIAAQEPDPRQELVRQLLDHDQLRRGIEFLKQKLEVTEATWSRSSVAESAPSAETELPEAGGALNLLQVLHLARKALAAARTHDLLAPSNSVDDALMVQWLEQKLAASPSGVAAGPLLVEQPDGPHRTALFLAMLQMAKDARIRLEQPECFGPISILPRSDLRA